MEKSRSIVRTLGCLTLLIASSASCSEPSNTDSFTKVCEIITSVDLSDADTAAERDAKAAEVWGKVKESLSKDAGGRVAFELAASASPGSEYALYKQSAQEYLGRNWDCPAWANAVSQE